MNALVVDRKGLAGKLDLARSGFALVELADGATLRTGKIPAELDVRGDAFDRLWACHPNEYHDILMRGRMVKTPRYQQAYGNDYAYSGQTNRALPLTPEIESFLEWGRSVIDARLNGVLMNWYDLAQGHHIGKHHDSTKGLIADSRIVTISLGERRVFRLRPSKGKGYIDFPTGHGTVFVMPLATNRTWKHEVPAHAGNGRRISITLRAFVSQAV